MEKKEYIVLGETLLESIVSDTYTILMLVFAVWFNVNFCANSYMLNGIILVMFFVSVVSAAGSVAYKKFKTPHDAIEYLKTIEDK